MEVKRTIIRQNFVLWML